MTTKTQTSSLIALIALTISLGIPSAFASEYGYQATNPVGGEITAIRGEMYTYLNHLDTNNKHVDTIGYLTNTGTFSIGVGFYDKEPSVGAEYYKWLKYWDEGSTRNNIHYVTSTGPTSETWKSWDVWAVDSNTYDFSIGSINFSSKDCISTCPNPTIAGVATYSSGGADSDDNVKGYFKDLELIDGGSTWDSWNDSSNDYKCNNDNSDFDLVTNSNIDDVKFDISSVDECRSNSSVWLYNGGTGG